MAEEESPEKAKPASRRQALTPELRRFLNTSRKAPSEPAGKAKPSEPATKSEPTEKQSAQGPPAEPARLLAAPVRQAAKDSRLIELQQAFLIISALLILAFTFYAGTKFNYVRYLFAARHKPKLSEKAPDRFPGIAPEDLVDQALVAQKEGRWQEAADRFMAAKRKDLKYNGILFRVGGLLYKHQQIDSADKAFERAIAFGENVDAANFYRGLIATHQQDFPAAEQYFEAAIAASPFIPDYQYYLGEVLRRDLKPKPSIPHYEKAGLLAREEQDAAVCRFKIRMARIEAAEGEAVNGELAKESAAGPLSVDWLMASAALQLHGGHVEAAREAITKAREGKAPGLFVSCANDFYFQDAAKKYPELAPALHLDLKLQMPSP